MCAGANRKMRLDKYLAEHGFSSRTKAARALAKGLGTRNGKVAKAGAEVKPGDVIELSFGQRSLRVEVVSVSESAAKADAPAMYRELA